MSATPVASYADSMSNWSVPLADVWLSPTPTARAVTLPLFAHMSLEQQDRVIMAVAAALEPVDRG